MTMTSTQAIITILIVGLVTLFIRLFPFALFPGNKAIPKYVSYLGKVLPLATIGMLIIYCLKDVSFGAYPHGLPEASAVAIVIALQLWRHNSLLSIGSGTLAYMILAQLIFV